jgi:beta-galactosidase
MLRCLRLLLPLVSLALVASCGKSDASTTCGDGRYTVLAPGNGPQDGSGRIKDNTTGLTWARFKNYPTGHGQAAAEAYCQEQGGRLPTESEALGIAGTNYDACAWPQEWETYTITAANSGNAWFVYSSGEENAFPVGTSGFYSLALCIY